MRVYDSLLPSNIGFVPVVAVIVVVLDVVVVPSTQRRKNFKALKLALKTHQPSSLRCRDIKNNNNRRFLGICVSGKHQQGSHIIFLTALLSKSFVLKMFFLHTKIHPFLKSIFACLHRT